MLLVFVLGASLSGCESRDNAQTVEPSQNAQIVLGRPWAGPAAQEGLGVVKPNHVNFGGDPTGDFARLSWETWGGSTATGTGYTIYIPPGSAYLRGRTEKGKIVAFDLGTCHEVQAYRAMTFYFPQHHETFNPDPAQADNICDGPARHE
ncbi:MAG: hypothetical protein WCD35_10130 [Mycobacteriales bacterium]